MSKKKVGKNLPCPFCGLLSDAYEVDTEYTRDLLLLNNCEDNVFEDIEDLVYSLANPEGAFILSVEARRCLGCKKIYPILHVEIGNNVIEKYLPMVRQRNC